MNVVWLLILVHAHIITGYAPIEKPLPPFATQEECLEAGLEVMARRGQNPDPSVVVNLHCVPIEQQEELIG